jgi:ankyrin repeat protein
MRGPSGLAPASSISTLCTSIDPSAALFRPIDRELPIHSRRLLLCVQQGDLNGVRKLLANGRVPANLRVRNPSDGWTALMLAALHGHKEMFRFLLERGHDDHHLSQVILFLKNEYI